MLKMNFSLSLRWSNDAEAPNLISADTELTNDLHNFANKVFFFIIFYCHQTLLLNYVLYNRQVPMDNFVLCFWYKKN